MTSVWQRELSDRCNEHWNVEETRESSRREEAKRQGCVFPFSKALSVMCVQIGSK